MSFLLKTNAPYRVGEALRLLLLRVERVAGREEREALAVAAHARGQGRQHPLLRLDGVHRLRGLLEVRLKNQTQHSEQKV